MISELKTSIRYLKQSKINIYFLNKCISFKSLKKIIESIYRMKEIISKTNFEILVPKKLYANLKPIFVIPQQASSR